MDTQAQTDAQMQTDASARIATQVQTDAHDQIEGIYFIKSKVTGKAIEGVYSNLGKDGSGVQTWDFNGTQHQQWKLMPVGDGTFVFFNVSPEAGNSPLLDASIKELGKDSGTVQLWSDNRNSKLQGEANQRWTVSKNSNGTFRIASAHPKAKGACLDVGGLNGRVQMWSPNDHPNQQWLLERAFPKTLAGAKQRVLGKWYLDPVFTKSLFGQPTATKASKHWANDFSFCVVTFREDVYTTFAQQQGESRGTRMMTQPQRFFVHKQHNNGDCTATIQLNDTVEVESNVRFLGNNVMIISPDDKSVFNEQHAPEVFRRMTSPEQAAKLIVGKWKVNVEATKAINKEKHVKGINWDFYTLIFEEDGTTVFHDGVNLQPNNFELREGTGPDSYYVGLSVGTGKVPAGTALLEILKANQLKYKMPGEIEIIYDRN